MAVKQKRRNIGDIDRSGEVQRKASRRKAGDIDRSAEVQRRGKKNKRKQNRAIDNPNSEFSIWTTCSPPSDEQLKNFEKNPYTAVAAFRLMAGIPADPRISSANLQFEANEEEIISRFSEFCGHDAVIKTCGACGVGDIMVDKESVKVPLSHKRVEFLECNREFLLRL